MVPKGLSAPFTVSTFCGVDKPSGTINSGSDADDKHLSMLFTKLPDWLPPYRMASGDCSVRQLPVEIFLFCRERPVTKELVAL